MASLRMAWLAVLAAVVFPILAAASLVSEERETLTRGLAGWVQRPEKPVPAAGNTSLTAAQGGVQMPLGGAYNLTIVYPRPDSRFFGALVVLDLEVGMPGKERGDGANCTVDFVMEGDRDEVVRRLPVEGIWKTRDAGSVLGLPLFFPGGPEECLLEGDEGGGGRYCYQPLSLPGPRRLTASLLCPAFPGVALASASITYHATETSHAARRRFEAARAAMMGPPLSSNPSVTYVVLDRPATLLTVDLRVGMPKPEPHDFCARVGGGRACIDRLQALIELQSDETYHSLVGDLHEQLHRKGTRVGTIEGSVYAFPDKFTEMRRALERPPGGTSTVCEIGFNAGHSSLFWLLYGRPGLRVFAFDIAEHSYMSPAVQFLYHTFADDRSFELVMGPSARTLRSFARLHPEVKCDVLLVDGGHTHEIAVQDIRDMEALANPDGHIVMVDDSSIETVRSAILECELDETLVIERRRLLAPGCDVTLHTVTPPGPGQTEGEHGWQVIWGFYGADSHVDEGHYPRVLQAGRTDLTPSMVMWMQGGTKE